MRDERKRSREEETNNYVKRRRPEEHHSHSYKNRSHIPMSERQQFALLRQMETEGAESEKAPDRTVLTSSLDASSDRSNFVDHRHHSSTHASYDDKPSRASGYEESGSSKGHHFSPSRLHASTSSARISSSSSSKKATSFRDLKSIDIESLRQMVNDGVDVNSKDEQGRTLLLEFTQRNQPRLVAYLLRHGANADHREPQHGNTALHEAVKSQMGRVVRQLLRYKASTSITNSAGQLPVDLTQDAELIGMLSSGGGSSSQERAGDSPTRSNQQQATSDSKSPSASVGGHRHHSHHRHSYRSTSSRQQHHHHRPHSVKGTPDRAHSSDCSDEIATSRTAADQPCSVTLQHNSIRSSMTVATAASSSSTTKTSPTALPSFSLPPAGSESSTSTISPSSGQKPMTTIKDPYAFVDDDDSDEVSKSKLFDSTTSTINPLVAPRRSSHNQTSNCSPLSTSVKPRHSSASALLTSEVGESSFQGPPLRLRLDKKKDGSGEYMLMEHQSPESDELPTVSVSNSASQFKAAGPSEVDAGSIDSAMTTSDVNDIPPSSSPPGNVDKSPELVTVQTPQAPPTTLPSLPGPPPRDLASPDEDSLNHPPLQKIPTLRIKFAEPGGSGTTPTPTLVDQVVVAPGDDDNQHSYQQQSTSTSEPSQRRSDDTVASDSPLQSDTIEPSSLTCSAWSDQLGATVDDSSEALVDDEVDADDLSRDAYRPRGSGRTLRSHTAAAAAQREREWKERHNDAAPIKKRRLRSRPETNGNVDPGISITNYNLDPSFQSSSSSPTNHHFLPPNNNPIDGDKSDHQVTAGTPLLTAASDESSLVGNEIKVSADAALPTQQQQLSSPIPATIGVHYKVDFSGSDYKPVFANTTNPVDVKPPPPIALLSCPMGPDDNKRHPELALFPDPFQLTASVNAKVREQVNSLVEVHPKAPVGYQDYLINTRKYLLADQVPSLAKLSPAPDLDPEMIELFEAQEDERHAQALKHQSEREHLMLCAEQAVLRAQTRAALAVANVSKPLSFCSLLTYQTHVPPTPNSRPANEQSMEEESARDRFTYRTFNGWLQDIKDRFQEEKRKLLCRQLHEAESLFMVQKLDWEIKLKELGAVDESSPGSRPIPQKHVPLISVPNDFPLFVHDPIQRSSSTSS